ncbi:MAG: hypothetical protein IKE94_09020, partial [Aeriscardovia sp.]|nr:hypothetical protein [Aeriscardovia sp.]
ATASGSFITALPDDLATTGFVAGVSSDIVSQIPSTAGLATEQWVENKGYLTAVDIPESATWNATTQTVSANSAQWAGGTANPQIPVTSTSGISIFESGDKVYFNISADYALADDLTAKQDSLTFGYKDTAISSIDESAIYDNSAHARINTLASRISDLSSNKLDESAFSDVSGTFLTAHQSLAGYATEDWVTAQGYLTAHQDLSDYQTTADMVNYQTTAAMTGYQEAGEYYSASNPSGFISEVPDTYLQNTDLSTEDGKVTAISGIPLSAGGDVPDGVMVESGLEYNAVNEISAYNGSAIAQYGAEKQWLVHDDTLVHLSNSAQYALGCNISALQRLMGIDETVLWTGSLTSSLSLSESMSSFNRVRFVMHCDNDTQINQNLIHEIEWNNGNMVTMADVVRYPATASFPIYDYRWGANIASNGKDISNVYHEMYWHAKNSWTGGGLNENAAYYPVKIIGIGRKEV